jgi:hypothetical protein
MYPPGLPGPSPGIKFPGDWQAFKRTPGKRTVGNSRGEF